MVELLAEYSNFASANGRYGICQANATPSSRCRINILQLCYIVLTPPTSKVRVQWLLRPERGAPQLLLLRRTSGRPGRLQMLWDDPTVRGAKSRRLTGGFIFDPGAGRSKFRKEIVVGHWLTGSYCRLQCRSSVYAASISGDNITKIQIWDDSKFYIKEFRESNELAIVFDAKGDDWCSFRDNWRGLRGVGFERPALYYICKHCWPEPGTGQHARMENRENRCLNHLKDPGVCPNAPAEVREQARHVLLGKGKLSVNEVTFTPVSSSISEPSDANEDEEIQEIPPPGTTGQGGSIIASRKKRKTSSGEQVHATSTLGRHLDRALSSAQRGAVNGKLFRTYDPPSRFILSTTVMDTEYARVEILELARLNKRQLMTFLIDGWEDALRRSLYGSVAAGIGEFPQMLDLADMTGKRGTADNLFDVALQALRRAEFKESEKHRLASLVTDDPTVMQSFRRKFQATHWWVLVFWCFLHKLNTIIGHILDHPEAKVIISQASRIVSFFNGSHFWGGQLKSAAANDNVKQKLRTHTESRWYSLIILCLIVLEYHRALVQICSRDDARRRIGGMTPVAHQIVKTCKPLVDAIGNLESREATLAECMLELIRCAREMYRIELDEEDEVGFWMHAKRVFNTEFHKINTDVHHLTLFLHPMCRKLATANAAKARTFETLVKTALGIAKQWRWDEKKAKLLIEDLRQYEQGQGKFAGGEADAKAWWMRIPDIHPLRQMAIVLHSIVPHTAEVERLFSNLGGIQGCRRINLTVENFKKLGILRNHYAAALWEADRKAGNIWKNGGVYELVYRAYSAHTRNLTATPQLSGRSLSSMYQVDSYIPQQPSVPSPSSTTRPSTAVQQQTPRLNCTHSGAAAGSGQQVVVDAGLRGFHLDYRKALTTRIKWMSPKLPDEYSNQCLEFEQQMPPSLSKAVEEISYVVRRTKGQLDWEGQAAATGKRGCWQSEADAGGRFGVNGTV
ncbi:hypothetical protein K474DRAFT_1694307 [Panus rudis PR-1116 ss-1]|nr:hypothetical protein K474DRAFT_1694307 [Panus rudis PR-1116 ss-1]